MTTTINPRDIEHVACDSVPNLGPPHCSPARRRNQLALSRNGDTTSDLTSGEQMARPNILAMGSEVVWSKPNGTYLRMPPASALNLAGELMPLRADLLAYGDLAVHRHCCPSERRLVRGLPLAGTPPARLTRILLGSAKAPVYEAHQKINVNSDYADRSPIAGTTLDLGATERLSDDDQ